MIFKVNCSWGNWNNWSSCSNTCGLGSKTRTREVQTRARNQGSQCQGSPRDTQSCYDRDCPGKFKTGRCFASLLALGADTEADKEHKYLLIR